ncbi:hypothetical protein [Thauera humireducens]
MEMVIKASSGVGCGEVLYRCTADYHRRQWAPNLADGANFDNRDE